MRPAGKIVAVYSGSGGVGKTLIAAGLASTYQQREGARVLLIDAGVPLPGDALAAIGIEQAKALGEMEPILAHLTPEIFSSYLVTSPSGVAALPLVADVLQASLVTTELLRMMLGLATAAYDLILVDMPSGVAAHTAFLVEQ